MNVEKYQRDVLDIEDAPGVNICVKNPYKWEEVLDDTYDVVISLNTFQHIEYFWITMTEIYRVLKEDGIFIMIAPSNRYDGKYPVACWAFNVDGLYAMAKYGGGLSVIDASVAGIPEYNVGMEWDSPHDDAVLIAKKGAIKDSLKEKYPRFKYSRRYTNDRHRIVFNWLKACINYTSCIDNYFEKLNVDEIYIYGAGDIGELLAKSLKTIKVSKFVDQNKTETVLGIDIIKLELIKNVELPIIVTVIREADEMERIYHSLKEKGFKNIIHIDTMINQINAEV